MDIVKYLVVINMIRPLVWESEAIRHLQRGTDIKAQQLPGNCHSGFSAMLYNLEDRLCSPAKELEMLLFIYYIHSRGMRSHRLFFW